MLFLWQRCTPVMFYYSSAPAAERGWGRHVGCELYPIMSRCQLENHLHLMGFHQRERWADKYQRRGAKEGRQLHINGAGHCRDGDCCLGAQIRTPMLLSCFLLTAVPPQDYPRWPFLASARIYPEQHAGRVGIIFDHVDISLPKALKSGWTLSLRG